MRRSRRTGIGIGDEHEFFIDRPLNDRFKSLDLRNRIWEFGIGKLHRKFIPLANIYIVGLAKINFAIGNFHQWCRVIHYGTTVVRTGDIVVGETNCVANLMGSQLRQLKKRRTRVDQGINSITCQQFATGLMPILVFFPAAVPDFLQAIEQIPKQLFHARRIGKEFL